MLRYVHFLKSSVFRYFKFKQFFSTDILFSTLLTYLHYTRYVNVVAQTSDLWLLIDRCLGDYSHISNSSQTYLKTQAEGSLCFIALHSYLLLAVSSFQGKEPEGPRGPPHQEHFYLLSANPPHPHLLLDNISGTQGPRIFCSHVLKPFVLQDCTGLLPKSNCASGAHSSRLDKWPAGSSMQEL